MRKFQVFISSLLLIFTAMACSSDDDGSASDSSVLKTQLCKTSWKLYGFGTVGSSEIKQAEPVWPTCYVVKFNFDGTFYGHSSTNDFDGTYSTKDNSLKIKDCFTTEICESGDGGKFYDMLLNSNNYEITDGNLKLYDGGNEFLQFYPKKDK